VPAQVAAQARVGGMVSRLAGSDTLPQPGARVVLHALTAAHQGPVDSTLADASGRFEFRVKPDTATLLLTSSRYDGIEYFSRPARATAARPDTGLVILVADTSSSAPVTLAGRYLMIGRPEQGGRRGALDLMVLQNRGDRTRVARDSSVPTWGMPLPKGIEDFTPGESEFSAAAVGHHGDSLTISAPLSPGDRQLMVTYTLPRGVKSLKVPFATGTDSVVFLLEEQTARVVTPGFAVRDSQVIETRTYRRWVGSMPAAGVVEVKFPVPGEGSREATLALAAVLAAGLLAGGFLLVRRRGTSGVAPLPAPSREPAALIDALARLDAQYAGRETELGADAWSRYVLQRAELKDALDAAVAARPPVR
jgi:hypothetical protein